MNFIVAESAKSGVLRELHHDATLDPLSRLNRVSLADRYRVRTSTLPKIMQDRPPPAAVLARGEDAFAQASTLPADAIPSPLTASPD